MSIDQTQASPIDMAMSPEDFAELRARVATISQSDVQLGRVLDLLVLHVGHAHGLDPAVEDAKAVAVARQAARDEEDARLKAEADALATKRTAEDAIPRTPEQAAALAAVRAEEDAQVAADAEALAKARAEEDAKAQGQPAQVAPEAFPAPVEQSAP